MVLKPAENTLLTALARLAEEAGSIEMLPNPDLFMFMYVRKEAVLSSQIEGTQSTLQDVLNPNQPRDVGDVLNYVRAMNHGLDRLASLPVSVRLIRELHAKLLEGARGHRLTPWSTCLPT